jgi:1,4-alpha-glucan branching enzyme
VREHYRIGVPEPGTYQEVFNTDETKWGGSGQVNQSKLQAEPVSWHNQCFSLELKLPPLGVVFLMRTETN